MNIQKKCFNWQLSMYNLICGPCLPVIIIVSESDSGLTKAGRARVTGRRWAGPAPQLWLGLNSEVENC